MSDVAKDLDFKYSLTRDLLPAVMNEDEQNLLKVLIEKYYMYMECYDIHYSNLVLDEPGITTEVPEDIQTESEYDILRESLRTQDSTFIVGETITGSTSKATAVVRGVQEKGQLAGGHTTTDPHHMWATPLNGVSFVLDENSLSFILIFCDPLGPDTNRPPLSTLMFESFGNDIIFFPNSFDAQPR